MNFAQLAEQANITFLDAPGFPEDLIADFLNLKVNYRINACGHNKFTTINTLRKGVSCATCTINNKLAGKYLETKNLVLNFHECSIECLDCERKYYRLPAVFKKDLNHWKCYCKGARTAEVEFYDFLVAANLPCKIYRSFSGYNVGINYSSDFLIVNGEDAEFIVHFDDDSHRNPVNQQRDLIKLRISDPLGYGNVFIQKKFWKQAPETVLETLVEVLEGPVGIHTLHDGGKFYRYLEEYHP